MKDKCLDCENTYHSKADECRRCELSEAKKELWNEIEKTKLYKYMVSCVEWLDNILTRLGI